MGGSGGNRANLGAAMTGARFVLVDGVVFEAEYLRAPDRDTVADDIVIEARNATDEIAFTKSDVDGAQLLPDGTFRLKSGAMLCFVAPATVH
jgi:hypothetical protein